MEAWMQRYSRQIMLDDIGLDGQEKLMSSTVTVVGAGGLGTPILTNLTAMGVGHIRLVDRDIVESTNLHRQTLYTVHDVGEPKVQQAARRLRALNEDADIVPIYASVTRHNAADIVRGSDVVVDALDSVEARYALNEACVDAGIPFISGGAVDVSGQVFVVMPGRTACYGCAFPGLDENDMPSCGIAGVNPAILSVIGGMQVAEASRVLCGLDPATLDRILHVNLATADFVTLPVSRVEECPVCGSGTREPLGKKYHVEELCSRGGSRVFAISPPERRRAVTHDKRVSMSEDGSAIVFGCMSEDDAVGIYNETTKPV